MINLFEIHECKKRTFVNPAYIAVIRELDSGQTFIEMSNGARDRTDKRSIEEIIRIMSEGQILGTAVELP